MVTDNQNLIIDKACKIIDIINVHLDEPQCRHSIDEILEDIDNILIIKGHWGHNPTTTRTGTRTNNAGGAEFIDKKL
jgi:hypothetical protein